MATQRNFTAEEAQKKMASLPEAVQELLYSPEMSEAIQKVGERNKLHYDQMGRLEMETTNVLLGFTETADYPGILAKVLSVSEAAANAIAKDVNETLFIKIRESMKSNPHSNTASIPAIKNPPAASVEPGEKSVVMPSAAKAPAPTPTDATAHTTPTSQPTMQTVPAAPKATEIPSIPHVDAMLSQPTVSIAPKPAETAPPTTPPTTAPATVETKVETPTPGPTYKKADPYHEPID